MKLKVYIFIICCVITRPAAAQIHTQGLSGLDITGGLSGIGVTGNVSYVHNFTENLYYKVGAVGEWGRLYNIKYSSYGLDALIFWNPFYFNDFIQFNCGAGPTLAYDLLAGVNKAKSANGVSFGGKAAIDMEVFFSDQMAFILYGAQSIMLKKELGTYRYSFGIGVRIFLNNYN